MQNGSDGRPVYPYGSSMNGYRAYSPANSPSAYSSFTPPARSMTLQEPVQDPDLIASDNRYGTNGNARYTPPSDALLNGYTTKLINGTHYNDENNDPTGKTRQSKLLDTKDPVAMHLLVETAIGDSLSYDVLSFDEVDRLKRELTSLHPRIESVRKRLALESKVRDAAASLNRLYSQGSSTSPPLNGQPRGNAKRNRDSISKSVEELNAANKRCADIARELYPLEQQQQKIQTQLLMHTAGVLQMTHKGPSAKRQLNEFPNSPQHGMVTGTRPDSPASIYTYDHGRNDVRRGDRDDFDERSLYRTTDEMHGLSFDGDSTVSKDFGQLGERLEDLNSRLKDAIAQASFSQNVSSLEAPRTDGKAATIASVNRQIDAISSNFKTFAASQSSSGSQVEQLQFQLQQKSHQLEEAINQKDQQYEDVLEDRNQKLAIAQKEVEQLQLQLDDAANLHTHIGDQLLPTLQRFNQQLDGILGAAAVAGFKGRQTPLSTSHGSQDTDTELKNMENSIAELSDTYQNLLAVVHGENERNNAGTVRADQMQATLSGLWTIILASEEEDQSKQRAAGEQVSSGVNANEPFDLQLFSGRIQAMVSQAVSLREQVQQSETQYTTAKRDHLEQLQNERLNTSKAIAMVHDERDERERKLLTDLESSQSNNTRALELEQQLVAKNVEVDQIQQVLEANRATTAERQNTLQELRHKLSAQEEELEQLRGKNGQEVERLENELVRLTTDLTIAKAELDAAYGSKAERKAEADTAVKQQLDDLHAEIATLKSTSSDASLREKELEDELKDTLKEFEELTRASVEAEKERDKLEATVDTVSQKLEEVEAQLGEERVKWLGVRSPGGDGAPVETASIGTMRAEFRKMMRDQRAEGIKALRAEQEERKKIEAQLRHLRKEREGPKKSSLSNLLSLS